MEENNVNNTTAQKPQGKGMGTAGFVISLIALVFWFIVAGIATLAALAGGGMGLAVMWLVLSLLGTALSAMGMMKLGKTGGKKGLSITGLILGIVATILSVTTVMGVNKVINSKVGENFKEAFENLADSAKLRETMNSAVQEMADSLKAH